MILDSLCIASCTNHIQKTNVWDSVSLKIVVSAYLSTKQGALRGKIAKRTDERVRVMTELISGVQVIKMYAWEKPFEKLVDTLRK